MSVSLNDLYERGEFDLTLWVEYLEGQRHSSLDVTYRLYFDECEEGGEFAYLAYLQSALPARREDKRKYHTIAYGRNILIFDRERIRQNKVLRDGLRGLEDGLRFGTIQHFAPSGPGALAFMEDREHSIKLLLAGNRTGKTSTTIVDELLDIIPTDPDSPIHTQYGVPWREFTGPKKLAICTYTNALHESRVWPELKRLLPLRELGGYAGIGRKGRKAITWDRNPTLPLAYSGSLIEFMTYSQAQSAYESREWHLCHFD